MTYDTFRTIQYRGVYIHSRHNRETGKKDVTIQGVPSVILPSVRSAKCRITQQQAVDWLNSAPGRTQQDAARLYGITQAAISSGLARRRAAGTEADAQVRRERLQCAILAENMGASHVAAAILKRG